MLAKQMEPEINLAPGPRKTLIAKHKMFWSDKLFVLSTAIGFLFFIGSLFVNYYALLYATKKAGNATADILLQNIPVINTDIIFSEGSLLFVIFIVVLFFLDPKKIPFTLKSIALFICIRSVFVIMTHLAPFPDHITTDLDKFRYISSGADLFFSGHTGLPFLMALLYWKNKHLRLVFLLSSAVAAIAVILGHLHYTIDVFSAFFITYGIYHISQRIFKADYKTFIHGPQLNEII